MFQLRRRFVLPAAAAAVILAGGGAAFAASSVTPTPGVTAATHIQNNPDGGGNGIWSDGQVNRSVTVSVDTSTLNCHGAAGFNVATDTCYSAVLTDSGTFTTRPGAFTPNQSVPGQHISNVVSGTFSGGGTFVLYALNANALTGAFPANMNDGGVAQAAPFSTSSWPTQAFATPAGVHVDFPAWSWTYTTQAGEVWTDAATTGKGQWVSDGNITGLQYVPPAVPRLSKGHAAMISGVREWVYFTLGNSDACVHFVIVGPGGINGHQGFVRAHVGLNRAFYAGLEYHHNYTVFYQAVNQAHPESCSGPGNQVPWPGSHWGYVDFESGA